MLALIGHKWSIPGSPLQQLLELDREAEKAQAVILSQRPSLLRRKSGIKAHVPHVHRIKLAPSVSAYNGDSSISIERPHCSKPQGRTINVLHLESDHSPWRVLVTSSHLDIIHELNLRFIIDVQANLDEERIREAETEARMRAQNPLCMLQEVISFFIDSTYQVLARIAGDVDKLVSVKESAGDTYRTYIDSCR